jgi:ELWxxDGT repeat protein
MLGSTPIRSVVLAFAAVALGAPAQAVTPSRVADINAGFRSEGSQSGAFTAIGGRVLFGEYDFAQDEGRLWSTAGIPGDLVRLGPDGLKRVSRSAVAGDRVYFSACDTSPSCGLWTTEGTPAGTRRLVRTPAASDYLEAVAPSGLPRTLLIFSRISEPLLWQTDGTPGGTRRVALAARRPRELVSFQGKGWFFADLPNAPGALFSTDGLPGGTRRIGTSTEGSMLFALGNRLMFFVGRELWSSDGTPSGTRRLVALPSDLMEAVVAGGRVFLSIGDPLFAQRDLWISDGTAAGTRRVTSYLSGNTGRMLALGGKVAFYARDAVHGVELWSSDGTSSGTRLVKDVCPGACQGAWEIAGVGFGRIWFAGSTPLRGIELWTSDLTPAGTRLVRDTCPGTCNGSPRFFFAADSRMYFAAGENKHAFWVSDGTPGGTLAVTGNDQTEFTRFGASLGGSKVVFAGFDADHGVEPWVSDGTLSGTQQLADLNSQNRAGSNPETLMAAGGRTFFFADDGNTGRELWVSDGTEEGTRLAYDQNPGSGSSRLERVNSGEAGGRLVLFAKEPFGTLQIIGSDGTPAGSDSLLPADVIPTGEQLGAGSRSFFFADDPIHGQELWATDSTPGGTVRLTDFVPILPFRPSGGFPTLFAVGDRVIAPVLASGGGEELWISDGTPGGTKPLREVYPFLEAPFQRAMAQPTQLGGVWYFLVSDSGFATLWRTDLTPGGTGLVDLLDLSRAGRGWILTALGDRILVFGRTETSSGGLWVSDGTALGTRIVAFPLLSLALPPVTFAGRLWFLVHPTRTLWTTDGTPEGTAPFFEDPLFSPTLRAMHVVGDRLVIAKDFEFLATDGTVAGTVPIEIPGRLPSTFLQPFGVGGRMYFPWSDPTVGTELWVLRPE